MSASKFPSQTTCVIAPPGLMLDEIGRLLCSSCFMLQQIPNKPRLKVFYVGGLIRGRIQNDDVFRKTYGEQFRQKELLSDFTVNQLLLGTVSLSSGRDEFLNGTRFVLVGFPCTKAQLDFAVREGLIDKTTHFFHLTSPQEERLARLETLGLPSTTMRTMVSEQETALMDVVANAERLCKTDTLRVAEPPPKFVPMLIKWLTAEAY